MGEETSYTVEIEIRWPINISIILSLLECIKVEVGAEKAERIRLDPAIRVTGLSDDESSRMIRIAVRHKEGIVSFSRKQEMV